MSFQFMENSEFLPGILRYCELSVLRDHFFKAVGDETDGELEVVAGSFSAEDRAVAVLRMLHTCAESPGAGGLFPGFRFGRSTPFFPAAQNFHDGIHRVVTPTFVSHGGFTATFP